MFDRNRSYFQISIVFLLHFLHLGSEDSYIS